MTFCLRKMMHDGNEAGMPPGEAYLESHRWEARWTEVGDGARPDPQCPPHAVHMTHLQECEH